MNMQSPPPDTDRELRAGESAAGSHPARWILIGGLALILVLGGYHYWTSLGAAPSHRGAMAAPVRVAKVVEHNMPVVEHTIGTVVAYSTVSVTARVQGQLTKAYFKEGQMVKKGQLLFQIDPATYQAAYDSAVANLATTKAKAERYKRLLSQDAIASQSADDAQAAYLQAKASLDMAKLNLQYTQIRSPVDGKTGPILLQPGNLVSVNGITAPLVTITQIQPIKVSFNLPQSDLPRIQAQAKKGGLVATVDLHDAGGKIFTAPVDFISNAVSDSAGTIELRATFPNTDKSLVPGQMVNVTVALADIKNAIVVPRVAVNTGPNDQYVYVVTPKHVVQEHPVKVLFDNGTDMAVQGDLKPGQMVITEGALRALPGGKVSVVQSGPQAAGAAANRKNGNDAESVAR